MDKQDQKQNLLGDSNSNRSSSCSAFWSISFTCGCRNQSLRFLFSAGDYRKKPSLLNPEEPTVKRLVLMF